MQQHILNINFRKRIIRLLPLALAVFALSAQASSTHSASETTHTGENKIITTKIGKDLFLLAGPSGNGNVILSVGNDGAFIIDDQTPQMTDSLNSAIKRISNKKEILVYYTI